MKPTHVPNDTRRTAPSTPASCGGPSAPELLAKLADALGNLTEWNHDACDHATRAVAEAAGVKAALLINATRVAIVGQAVAPPLFDTMVALGQQRVVRRLHEAVSGAAKA